jgi:hypothetical protein
MKNIAYKTAQGIANLPDGFILDHIETDQDAVEGYTVVSKEAFSVLMANNVPLFRNFEKSRGVLPADPNAPPPVQKTNSDAQPHPPEVLAAFKKAQEDASNNAQMFQQFLAWQKSQGSKV